MKRACLLSLFLALMVPCMGLSATIYVDISNTAGPWDGSALYPFQSIQQGMNMALDYDTVLVSSGTYFENLDFLGKSITVTSDSGPYSTIINGNRSGSVAVFINDEDADAVLDGFTITNGSGTYTAGSPPLYNGGGIYCFSSSPTIINNIIIDNVTTADGMGGGICCHDHATPLIKNNTIVSNLITSIATDYLNGGGGGVCCMLYSDATITENTIVGNEAAYAGGGVFCLNNASPTISYNYISQNFSGYAYGGGVFCKTYCAPLVTHNIISYNHTDQWGGGVYAWKSTPTISYNYIYGNTADNGGGIYLYDNSHSLIQGNYIWNNSVVYDGAGIFCANTSSPQILDTVIYSNTGGGIYCFSSSSPKIVNTLIYNNTADYGAGIYCTGGSSPTITNSTITSNTAEFLGGGIFTSFNQSSPIITNSILWNNTAPTGPDLWIGDPAYPSTVTISYSCVTNGKFAVHVEPGCGLLWGTHMISTNPLFVDADNHDYHLKFGSPCIDIGNNSAPSIPANDFEGRLRVFDGDGDTVQFADLGYSEFTPLHVPLNYATIQEALDAAQAKGDTILVAKGVYTENINF
ncbi:MAG: right-handed parallel beta-helix repeat-containing protein, partial [Planctomycetota bacterium]